MPENRKFTAQINNLGWKGDWQGVKRIFASIENKNAINYNAAMAAADRCGQYDEGLRVFNDLRESGIVLTGVSYASALTLLGRLGKYNEASQLWSEMMESGTTPTPSCLTGLLNAAAVQGNIAEVRRRLQEAKNTGWVLEEIHLACLVRAARESCDPDLAFDALEEMRSRGSKPHIVAYTLAMGACCRAAEADKIHFSQVKEFCTKIERSMRGDGINQNAFFLEERVKALLGGKRLELVLEPSWQLNPSALHASVAALDQAAAEGIRKTRLIEKIEGKLRSLSKDVAVQGLPAGWQQTVDPGSGAPYYWHTTDPAGSVTWQHP